MHGNKLFLRQDIYQPMRLLALLYEIKFHD